MKKTALCFCFLLLLFEAPFAQSLKDSVISMKEVTISIYPSKPLLLHSTTSVLMLGEKELRNHSQLSMVPALNSLPGLRMEERSPGSYRLSIRGSLLRSPFGIRNIKIYMDEFPLTDAGGNTYLNLIDVNAIKNIQVLKGPEGSMFGANTGGVIEIGSESKGDSAKANLLLTGGSYGTFQEHLLLKNQWKKYSVQVCQSYQRSDGYRKNSAMERNFMQLLQKFRYKKGETKVFLMASRLRYETPGGLSLLQYQKDPRSARPATSSLPGAEEQKAGIYNSTLFGGISNEVYILPQLKHVIAVFGSYTDFKNPFITNYETRLEQTKGVRSYLNLEEKFAMVRINWNVGVEYSHSQSRISNFDNLQGGKGELQAKDDLTAEQCFFFSQLNMLISTRLQLEIAASLNNNYFRYRNIYPDEEPSAKKIRLDTRLLPRIGISYRIVNNLVWRASASEGYSAPTIAELRPSDNIIHGELQSEYGWNYETGFRFKSLDEMWEADLVVFRFDLKDAIVRRTNSSGAEYFVNAGGTRQQGLELSVLFQPVKPSLSGFIRETTCQLAYTLYDFYFSDYQLNTEDYSGKMLTGVPQQTAFGSLRLGFPANLYLFAAYTYTDRIALKDDNSVYASAYNLLQAKAGWRIQLKKKNSLEVFSGADNILDESYSLGNDLNAPGSRYYNPAPRRNFYAGILLSL